MLRKCYRLTIQSPLAKIVYFVLLGQREGVRQFLSFSPYLINSPKHKRGFLQANLQPLQHLNFALLITFVFLLTLAQHLHEHEGVCLGPHLGGWSFSPCVSSLRRIARACSQDCLMVLSSSRRDPPMHKGSISLCLCCI